MSIGKGRKTRAAATRVPPEVLLDILASAGNKTLRSAALVHPSWRIPSQYLLHCELSLPSRKIAKSFLQVEGRKCYAKKLSLPISLDTEDCWEILENVKGLEHLTLVAQEGATGKSKFEVDLLEASSLAGESWENLKGLISLFRLTDLLYRSSSFLQAFALFGSLPLSRNRFTHRLRSSSLSA
jgi:hypothetical protein